MVSTRSQTAQTHIGDYTTTSSTPKSKDRQHTTQRSPPKANTSKKRKSIGTTEPETSIPKRTRTSNPITTSDTDSTQVIIINRAPVLHLWSACVAHTTQPTLSWDTCLSVGSAVSTICAVAKGRSIGTVTEKDGLDEKAKEDEDLDVVQTMHFNLKLKNGLALAGSSSNGKPPGEGALRKKFGEAYGQVRGIFEEALESWKGKEEELNERAFGFYEEFRPAVKNGQKGWGRKGVLDLGKVKATVARR